MCTNMKGRVRSFYAVNEKQKSNIKKCNSSMSKSSGTRTVKDPHSNSKCNPEGRKTWIQDL